MKMLFVTVFIISVLLAATFTMCRKADDQYLQNKSPVADAGNNTIYRWWIEKLPGF